MIIFVIASTLVDGGLSIGEMFGFAGLVAVMLLFAAGYAGYRVVDNWADESRARAAAVLARDDKLAMAQVTSYARHVEFIERTAVVVDRIVDNSDKTGKLIEMLASTSAERTINVLHIRSRMAAMERMTREAVRLAANQPDISPSLKDGLYRILDDAMNKDE